MRSLIVLGILVLSVSWCHAGLVGYAQGYHSGGSFIGQDPDISPDGKTIVFSGIANKAPGRGPLGTSSSVGDAGDIYLINIANGDISRLTKNPGFDGMPSFSPDGKTIVFVSDRDSTSGLEAIFTMTADGKNIRRVTNSHKYRDLSPIFFPNGQTILFARKKHELGSYLCSVDVNGANDREIVSDDFADGVKPLDITPDGKKILVYKFMGKMNFLDRISLKMEPIQPLQSYSVFSADISPSGDSIAFIDAGETIYVWSVKKEKLISFPSPVSTHSGRARIYDIVFNPDESGLVVFATPDAAKNRSLGSIFFYSFSQSVWKKICDNYEIEMKKH